MAHRFLVQIVDAHNHEVLRFPGGSPLERDLIEAVTAEILKRGVGLFRTEAHVAEDIREGLTAALLAVKKQAKPFA